MQTLKTFNLNATKALTVISIIVVLLWVLPYAVPSDPSTLGANPTGWGIFAVFMWGLYCAFAATEYRSLRGLGMRPRQWLTSMHATLWLAALIFGAVAWTAYYIALQSGAYANSSWAITPGTVEASLPFCYAATFGSFACGHLITGYVGALIGVVVSSANQSSLFVRLLLIAGIIIGLFLADGILITLVESFGAAEIGAPWPGLFFFTALSIIICSAGIHFIARRIQP